MYKKLPAFLLLLIVVTASAQKKDSTVGLYISPAVTLLNGDHNVSQAISLGTGLRLHQWQIGAGVAIDYYKIRSLPIYLDLKYKWKGQLAPFLFFQGGYNVAWALDHQHTNAGTTGRTVYNNGTYFNGGAGMYVFRKGREALFFSLGYSVKKLTELYQVGSWINSRVIYNDTKLDYALRRIALTVAYEF
ncbi:hypothetical protein [Filimonas effusa]|uniref:Outer membrane protein beta-barrel domain-containing protein n=1 Tax=Filimonas effusa TaxID=2508721 RepID=A0A4Q1D481_9BACT|nr:hypothetical protein [Filimonas effusa]RXK81957.1 hypothetical protein ESB13_19450 [Filimonas effusa]